MLKTRRFDIDFIAGLCILNMMWVHAMQLSSLANSESYQIITTMTSGYMAWFFFKSGMLHKEIPLKNLKKKMSTKILIPFTILSLIAIVSEICYGLVTHHLVDGKPYSLSLIALRFIAHTAPSLNLALWFLPCFFLVHILLAVLQKKIPILIIAIIALVFGTIFDYLQIYRECFGGNVFFGLFFFCCGIMFKVKQYEKISLIIASFVVLIGIFFPHYISAATNSMHVGIFYPFGMCFFLGKIFLIDRLFKNVPLHKSIVALVGENAMFCFALHYFFLAIGKIIVVEIIPEISATLLFVCISTMCTLGLLMTHVGMSKLGIRNYL